MKIEYKILWLDDQIRQFVEDELVQELISYLSDEGFKPIVDTVNNCDNFFQMLDSSYDLILTDYHMKDMQGDKVVEKIRGSEYSVMTEILFYTARADLASTNKISRVSFLETSTRSGSHGDIVLAEAKKLVGITINKFQHIVAMRGMIMHETCQLDTQMLKALASFIDNSKNSAKAGEIAEIVLSELETLFVSKLERIKNWRSNRDLKSAAKDNFVFSAKYKIITMGEILKSLLLQDFSAEYDNDINKVRNKFAHAILEIDPETSRKFFKANDVTFDEIYCKKIRKDIVKHESNLESLIKKLLDC